jgi:hypothetical protein
MAGLRTNHMAFQVTSAEPIALLHGEEAARAMELKPKRRPPGMLVLQIPHEAAPPFNDDWTLVKGSSKDASKWEKEMRLRDDRNCMIREYLERGRPVLYKSSGSSMWPLVQSNDAILLHPIQAVTADKGKHAIQKEASEIGVGDIVFCEVQPNTAYFCHIVVEEQWDYYTGQPKYWIGSFNAKVNGWCRREHIFGILISVEVEKPGEEGYYIRPLPKEAYEQVKQLVKADRWNKDAEKLCEALDVMHSDGQQG